MKTTTVALILLVLLMAVPLSQRSTVRTHSESESSKIFGAFDFTNGLVEVGLFSKCGVADQCKENTCPDEDCRGFEITPVEGAPNQGCSRPAWFSVCVSTGFGFLVGQVVPKCAEMGPACIWIEDPVTGIGYCEAVVGQGFTRDPTAPETCTDGNLIELVF